MSDAVNGPGSRVPALRTVAAVMVWVEALALAGVGVAYGIHAVTLEQPLFAVGLAVFALSIAAGLAAAGRGLRRGARWAVSAVITWQALLTLAGLSLAGERPALGVPAALVGAVVGVLVLAASREVIARRD